MAVPLPALYLSAIDEEVHTSREEVAAALKAMGCDVISVVHAELLPQPPELRMKSLRQVNKAVLAGLMKSAAMIQLVGQSEGRMPPLPGKKNSGLGALAMEARYMKAFRRPVYYIVLGDSYPVDRAGGLPAQDAAYRRQVAALPADVYHSGSLGETLQIVHGLKDLLLKAAERQRRKAKLPALLLKISSGLLVLSQLLFFMDARWEREAAEKAARAKYDQACKEVAAVVMKEVTSPLPRWETEAGVRYEHLVKRVAYQHLFHEQWLRYELRCQAAAALKDPASSLQAKVEALHGAGFFLPGKDFAEPASGKAQQQDGVQNVQEVQVWIAAAKFCLDSGNAPEAEMHAVTALSLADRESDFATWAAARHEMGRVLLFQGQDEKGLELFQELVLQRTAILGAEHPDTLLSRRELGQALFRLKRYEESESEMRSLLSTEQRVLGAEHVETLRTRMAFAQAIGYQGQYFEAERQLREVLRVQERVLGSLHPDTLTCDYQISCWMSWLGRREGALKYAQRALTGMLQVHGNDHWETRWAKTLVKGQSPQPLASPTLLRAVTLKDKG